jgi:hypothetical protein
MNGAAGLRACRPVRCPGTALPWVALPCSRRSSVLGARIIRRIVRLRSGRPVARRSTITRSRDHRLCDHRLCDHRLCDHRPCDHRPCDHRPPRLPAPHASITADEVATCAGRSAVSLGIVGLIEVRRPAAGIDLRKGPESGIGGWDLSGWREGAQRARSRRPGRRHRGWWQEAAVRHGGRRCGWGGGNAVPNGVASAVRAVGGVTASDAEPPSARRTGTRPLEGPWWLPPPGTRRSLSLLHASDLRASAYSELQVAATAMVHAWRGPLRRRGVSSGASCAVFVVSAGGPRWRWRSGGRSPS